MPFTIVVAVSKNNVIGDSVTNDLPWKLPNDMKHFMKKTMGKTVVMGRKTWDSLRKKPLPDRECWVLSTDLSFQPEGAVVFRSLNEVLDYAARDDRDVMVIGGEAIYRLFLPFVERLEVTHVNTRVSGDRSFDAFKTTESRHLWCTTRVINNFADDKHAFDYHFTSYVRRKRHFTPHTRRW